MSFSLVYGCEAVIPLEIKIPSIRVALVTKMTDGDNDRLRLQKVKALDEKRLQALQRSNYTKPESQKASTKRSKRVFHKGDLVLAVR